MPNLLEQNGARPQKEPKYVPLFIDRAFTGLFTQRSVLHDPSDLSQKAWGGGRPDSLWMGSNIELTNRLTLQRRPGLSPFSTTTYPTAPDRAFSFQLLDGTIQVIIDTATAVYVDNQNGTKTLLFTKSVGAGQTYFVAVAGVLYMGDGVETRKYTPGNPNGTVWNFGGATPTVQPTVVITSAAASPVAWQANTWFSTMGIIIDSNGAAQQLISVNALGTNSTQFGTSGTGQPAWNQTPGGTTTDNTVTWENKGPIGTWTPGGVFSGAATFGTLANPAVIYDPGTNSYYENSRPGGLYTAGSTPPAFTGVVGSPLFEGGNNWVCLGSPTGSFLLAANWTPSTAYANPLLGGLGVIIEPVSPPVSGETSYAQFVITNGTSAASYSQPNWSTIVGGTTPPDGDLLWVKLSTSVWAPSTPVVAWTHSNDFNFNCVVDSVNQLQVCIQGGTTKSGTAPWHVWVSGGTVAASTTIIDTNGNKQFTTAGGISVSGPHPVWATTTGSTTADNTVTWVCLGPAYGFTTADNDAIWVCVGPAAAATWTANQIYYLPKVGFSPPTSSSPYGGAAVVDTVPNDEFVIVTGVSGAGPAPTFNATVGGTTADNTVLWINDGPAPSNVLAWQRGYVYAYSYKARSLTDFYSVIDPATGQPPIPPGLTNPLPAPTGSETGLITTASPVFTITGPNPGAVNTISGPQPTDPQFDTIVIWRSADGGGAANMFELTEIPANPGSPAPWVFVDFLPDTPTASFPGLNTLIPAPIDDSNDPPSANFLPMVYNFQRIWGTIGQSVAFSGGPDVLTGNANEAFAPADSLPFLANVIRLVKTSQGLVTFLTDSIEIIAGGPQTASFYSVTLAPGTGLLSYNALDQFAGEIYFFTSDNRFAIISPSLNLATSGFPIGDQLANLPSSGISDATWNPKNVYVAYHQNGIDSCLLIADGSTGWYRQNPHQVPGGAQGPEPVWSPFANITGGCKMVQSVETAPGTKTLLVGSPLANKKILKRDLTVFTDDGTAYDAWFVMGAITLAHPGQLAVIKFFEFDFSGVSYEPTVSFLLNELSGTFTPFTLAPVFDPPSIYGQTIVPGSYSPNRYYFSATQSLARCRHLQIMVDFGTTSNGDELYDMAIFGRLLVES